MFNGLLAFLKCPSRKKKEKEEEKDIEVKENILKFILLWPIFAQKD